MENGYRLTFADHAGAASVERVLDHVGHLLGERVGETPGEDLTLAFAPDGRGDDDVGLQGAFGIGLEDLEVDVAVERRVGDGLERAELWGLVGRRGGVEISVDLPSAGGVRHGAVYMDMCRRGSGWGLGCGSVPCVKKPNLQCRWGTVPGHRP